MALFMSLTLVAAACGDGSDDSQPGARTSGDARPDPIGTREPQAARPGVALRASSRLVLPLRDLTRPDQTCGSEHPLSGCATADWSDFEPPPHVPGGGVFTQRLMLTISDGPHDFFLSERAGRAPELDDFSPG
jgi:hypothetical protein